MCLKKKKVHQVTSNRQEESDIVPNTSPEHDSYFLGSVMTKPHDRGRKTSKTSAIERSHSQCVRPRHNEFVHSHRNDTMQTPTKKAIDPLTKVMTANETKVAHNEPP